MTSESKRPVLYDYFRRTSDSLRASSQQAGALGASANLGSAREVLVRDFLQGVVPSHLRVERGEIWDSEGKRTGQLDVLLVRSDTPRLPLAANDSGGAFIAEGVYAVVEVKSNLTAATLKEDLGKLRRVSELKILPSTVFYTEPAVDRPLRMIFGFEGATLDGLAEVLSEPESLGIADAVCALDRGALLETTLAGKLGIRLREGAPRAPYLTFAGSALGLGMFHYGLTAAAAAFAGRSVRLGEYLNPLNGWDE